jgi:hypothetical protein
MINQYLESITQTISEERSTKRTIDKVRVGWSKINLKTDGKYTGERFLGLIVNCRLQPREYICNYLGTIYTKEEISNNIISGRYSQAIYNNTNKIKSSKNTIVYTNYDSSDEDDDYDYVIDASEQLSCFARFVNCPPEGISYNASLVTVKHNDTNRQFAVELRAGVNGLDEGDEVLVSYGDKYWFGDIDLKNKHNPSRRRAKLLALNEKKNSMGMIKRSMELEESGFNDNNEYSMDSKKNRKK